MGSPGSLLNQYVFGGGVSGPPGLVSQHPDGTGFVTNPDGSRTYVGTGQTFMQKPGGGEEMVTNPSVAQQVGANNLRASGFYNQVPGYDAREANAFGQEQGVADILHGIVTGAGGPTVAGTQLAAGQDQALRGQLAAAGGASGPGAALARMTAMDNAAKVQAQTNQAAGLQRAAEQTQAINSLGTITGNMEQQSAGMAGQKIGAGNTLAGLSQQGEAEREGLTERAGEKNADNNKDAVSSLFGGAGAVLSLL